MAKKPGDSSFGLLFTSSANLNSFGRTRRRVCLGAAVFYRSMSLRLLKFWQYIDKVVDNC